MLVRTFATTFNISSTNVSRHNARGTEKKIIIIIIDARKEKNRNRNTQEYARPHTNSSERDIWAKNMANFIQRWSKSLILFNKQFKSSRISTLEFTPLAVYLSSRSFALSHFDNLCFPNMLLCGFSASIFGSIIMIMQKIRWDITVKIYTVAVVAMKKKTHSHTEHKHSEKENITSTLFEWT